MTTTTVRLGSTYRFKVVFYALSDGTTAADLDAVPTLQCYKPDGTTTVGPAVTCTRSATGTYYGDITFTTSNTFTTGTYIWKMSGLAGGYAANQTGKLVVVQVV